MYELNHLHINYEKPNHLHVNYEELIEYIKAKQPRDSAELTRVIKDIYPNDRKFIDKIIEVLMELDPYIREIECSWYIPPVDHITITFDVTGKIVVLPPLNDNKPLTITAQE